MESYKYKSKLANVLVFIAGLISYVGVDGLKRVVPLEYAEFIPIIVLVAGYIVVQLTEDKRVYVAEELVREETNNPFQDIGFDEPVLNDEYTTTYDDSGEEQ